MGEVDDFQASDFSVVVVDDEEAILAILSQALEMWGYRVAAFSKPQEAVPFIAAGSVDLLLTDFHMPEFNGLQLIQALRESGWEGAALVMSGRVCSIPHEALKNVAAPVLIEKPFSVQHLHQVIREALRFQPE